MIRRLVWTSVMMCSLAFGSNMARAEEGHGERDGKLHEACKADREKFCKGVMGDHEAVRKCMKEHEQDLSEACKQAREEMKKHEHKGGKPGPSSTTVVLRLSEPAVRCASPQCVRRS